MEKVTEPPTIAGPDSDKQNHGNEVEKVKLKIDNCKKINFPKISISKEELAK